MKRILGLVLAMMLLATLASTAMAESQGRDMYVRTNNGKNLLVRSSMSAVDDSNVIGSLSYGQRVIIYGQTNGWAVLDYGNTAGYVMYRYLSKDKPDPYNPSDSTSRKTNAFSTKDASTVDQMNSLLSPAKIVTPYTVTVRPTRASGWVYMRWFPSKSAKELATFNGNYDLTVIAELKDWYQVSDPATGKVGFIYKSYVQ